MFYTDSPIATTNEDILYRGSFVCQLTETIISQKTKDSFVLGLYGSWGSGKTSILNLLEESVSQINVLNDIPVQKIIRFEPWGYVDSNQLINQFFATLSSELKYDQKDKQQIKVGEAIEKYAFSLEFTKSIPVVSSLLSFLPSLTKLIGRIIKDRASSRDSNIIYQKNKVIDALGRKKCRYIILIDDIDRLPNEQIRMIFQLVKAIADFPYITYILAFDKTVVSRALHKVQDCDGDKYLEKIIQVPFSIPEVPRHKIYSILIERLNSILSDSVELYDNDHWYRIEETCLSPYIRSLRDVNRFINVLEFKYSPLRKNVNPVDFVGITALDVFASPIYEWIKQNKEVLTKSETVPSKATTPDKEKARELWLEKMKQINPDSPITTLRIIASLFPKIAYEVNLPYDTFSEEELSQKFRVGSFARFDLYYTLQFENSLVTYMKVLASINFYDEDTFKKYVSDILNSNALRAYLLEIKLMIDRIAPVRIPVVFTVLFSIMDQTPDEKERHFEKSTMSLNNLLIISLLQKIDNENDRFTLFISQLIESSYAIFLESSWLIVIMEYALGRLWVKDRNESYIVFGEENIRKIEAVFLQKISEISKSYNILESRCFSSLAIIWEKIDPNSFSNNMNLLLTDPRNILLYISSVVKKETSLDKGIKRKTFRKDELTKFVSVKKALESLNSAIAEKVVLQLPFDQQVNLAAFMLSNSGQNKYSFDAVLEKDAEKLAAEWSTI